MFDMLLSLISGPLLGGLFGCINSWIANKEKQAMREHEVNMAREDRETRRVEAEMQMRVTEEEFAGKAFLASQTAGNKTALSNANIQAMLTGGFVMRTLGGFIAFLLGLTDVARNIVRPGITIYLAVACQNMLATYIEQIGGIGITQRMEIVNYGVQAQFNLLSTCVAWWFGDRMTTQILRAKG